MYLAKEKPIFFGIKAGFEDLTSLHNDWLKSFLYDNEDQTLLAHRGSFKTSTLAVAFALLIVLFPNKSILFFRKTDTDVTEIIVQTAKILKSEHFQLLVRLLYGVELVLIKETTSEIDTNLKTSSRGSSQLIGLGIGSSITGKHADIVVTDDIVNLKDRVSKAEREKTIAAYMELQNIKNRGGRFINTGTPWHKDDAISQMPNVTKYDVFSTGLVTEEEINSLKQVMTLSLFSANYELKHISDEEAIFAEPRYTEDIHLIYDGVAQIDAGYGGSDATAFTIMKRIGGRIIAFGKKYDKHVDDALPDIYYQHAKYRAGTIYNELNADKGYLIKQMNGDGKPTHGYHETTNKFIKIVSYLKKYWNQIEWIEGTDLEYINSILEYTENSSHDDCPDSAASLVRVLFDVEDEPIDVEDTINFFKGLGL